MRQHDNAPSHSPRLTIAFFEQKHIKLMKHIYLILLILLCVTFGYFLI